MIPLCITAISFLQSIWGCAFSIVGVPWVAHRVCAIPIVAWILFPLSFFSSSAILPTAFSHRKVPFSINATPEESYPRYSSLLMPSRRTLMVSLCPIYPTIPHIRFSPKKIPHIVVFRSKRRPPLHPSLRRRGKRGG